MKSDTLRITGIVVVAIGAIGLVAATGLGSCAAADRQEDSEKEQCKQMCTSGVLACKETTDYQSLVVRCSTDAGVVLRVTEVVKVK
jgi:hypothetical protein